MATTGSTEQELKFESGKRFLIMGKYLWNPGLQEVYVETITEKAYKLRKACTDGSWYIEWIMIKDFHEKNNIVEYLDTLSAPPALPGEEIQTLYYHSELCGWCGGEGTIPDSRYTAGRISCPNCLGSGWKIQQQI